MKKWMKIIILVVFAVLAISLFFINQIHFATFASLITVIAFMIFLFQYFFPKFHLTNEQLRTQALDLSDIIMDFVRDRQNNEPQIINNNDNNWNATTQEFIQYYNETINLYIQRYASRVNSCYSEFKKRKITDEELERLKGYPVNYIGIRMVAIGLGTLGRNLLN